MTIRNVSMKLLHSIRRAIFGPRKVNTIVRQFDTMVDDLTHTATVLRNRATDRDAAAMVLQSEAKAHRDEAFRAQVTANRIANLIA